MFHRTRSGRAHHRSGLNRRARAASGSGNQRSRMARHRRQVGVRSSSVSAPVDAIPAIVFHRIPHRVFGVQRRSVRCVNLSLVGEFGRVRDGTAGFVSSVPASLRSRSPSSRCRARTCRVCAGGCRQSAWPTAAGSPRRSRRSSPAGTRAAVQPSSESSRSSSERSPSPRCDSCEPLPHPSRRQQISLLRESAFDEHGSRPSDNPGARSTPTRRIAGEVARPLTDGGHSIIAQFEGSPEPLVQSVSLIPLHAWRNGPRSRHNILGGPPGVMTGQASACETSPPADPTLCALTFRVEPEGQLCCTDVVRAGEFGTSEALPDLPRRASELVFFVRGGGRIRT